MTFTYLPDPEHDGTGVLLGDGGDLLSLAQQILDAASTSKPRWRDKACFVWPCECSFATAVNGKCIWGPGGDRSWYDSARMRPFAGEQEEVDLVELGERVTGHLELLGTLRMPCRIPGEISATCDCDNCEMSRAWLDECQADNTNPKEST